MQIKSNGDQLGYSSTYINCSTIYKYTVSHRDEQPTLIINKNVVFIIPNIVIKDDILQQAAAHLEHVEELPTTPIAEAILLPKKRKISVEGKVPKVNYWLSD